jgi:hypothetical protein
MVVQERGCGEEDPDNSFVFLGLSDGLHLSHQTCCEKKYYIVCISVSKLNGCRI